MGDPLRLPNSVRADLQGARAAYAKWQEADDDFFDLDDSGDALRRFWSSVENVIRDSLADDVDPGKLATALGSAFPRLAAELCTAVNSAGPTVPPAAAFDDLSTESAHERFVGAEAPVVLRARPYTVEPGFPECGHILASHKGGGLGSARPLTRYFNFFDNDLSPLGDFLRIMQRAGSQGRHEAYCTSSLDEVDAYIGKYLGTFLNATPYGEHVIREIHEHLREFPMRQDYFRSESYRENMVMHSRFFQDFFYDSAHMVAAELVPDKLLDSCCSAFGLPVAPMAEDAEEFVERLSSNPKYRIYTDVPSGSFRAVFGANSMDDFVLGPAFHCSLHDYENYIRPYILFLSNWSLVLGVYLALRVFGQCAFVLCWEPTWEPASRD